MEYRIRKGRREDAEFIADAVMAAIGMEICEGMSANQEQKVLREAFIRCAARPDSQYSYRNALIAESDSGEITGAIVGYDGADLHILRQAFVEEYNDLMGTHYKEEEWSDETSPDEIYLDTLAVVPSHRKKGVATMLINAFSEKYAGAPKPIGLLVDYDNPDARRLYESLGFEPHGPRSFFGTPMEHLLLENRQVGSHFLQKCATN